MLIYENMNKSEQRAARGLILSLIGLINIFVLALVVYYGFSSWQSFGTIREESKLRVALGGEGRISARPDVAKITAIISTENEFLKTAQEENSKKSNALSAYLKSQSVDEKDIKTTGYNIFPQYSHPRPCNSEVCPLVDRQPGIIGYQVINSYEITMHDLSKAGGILAGVVGAGANEVGGISFTIDKPEQLKAEARKKAIEDAEAKAKILAKDLGKRVGKIVSFSEGGYAAPQLYLAEAQALGKGGGGYASAPSVQPGENEITVTVSITYEFN